MGIGKNLLQAAKDYLESGDEAKAYTLLSQDDLKAASVPMFTEGGGQGNSGVVPIYSSMQAWDRAINSALMGGWNNTRINYAAEIGDLRLSVLLQAVIGWAGVNLGLGRMQVVELDADEKETNQQNHPLTMLFKKPNPDSTGKALWKQFANSYVIDGEAYFLIGRDNAKRVRELYYEPNATIEPRWDKNLFPEDETANEMIQYFEIKRSGRWIPVRKMDVFRIYDSFDPVTRRGTNGVSALMRTIFTDNEREQYTALLLKNFGVTPKGVAPKNSGLNFDTTAVSNDLQRRWSGDDRGKPMAFNEPMEVLDFSTDFSADAMERIANISESRVAAAARISAQSLRFMVSMQSSSYNNIREFRREDFEQWVMPVHEDFDEAAQNQLLPQMDERENLLVKHDYSRVAIVQRDKMETAKETEILVKNRVIDQAEARERHAYDFEPEGDPDRYKGVFYPVPSANITLSPIGGSGEEPKEDAPPVDEDEETKAAKTRLPKSQLDEGADEWRKHPALNEDEQGLIDATEYKPS